MKRIPLFLAVLLLVMIPTGCKSGLDPGLMKLSVKPLADLAVEAEALQPDATLVADLAEKAAAGLEPEDRAAAGAAIAKVRKFFDVPVKPGVPNVIHRIAAGAVQTMKNIETAGETP